MKVTLLFFTRSLNELWHLQKYHPKGPSVVVLVKKKNKKGNIQDQTD